MRLSYTSLFLWKKSLNTVNETVFVQHKPVGSSTYTMSLAKTDGGEGEAGGGGGPLHFSKQQSHFALFRKCISWATVS